MLHSPQFFLSILFPLQVFLGIALGVHTCSCIFWLCKVLSHPGKLSKVRT
jgi:hypothetical protein